LNRLYIEEEPTHMYPFILKVELDLRFKTKEEARVSMNKILKVVHRFDA